MPNLFGHCRTGVSVYPASGIRISNSGSLYHVGTLGYTWSSSPGSASSVYGSDLNFVSSGVYPESNDVRADGFPVRCKQE